MTEQLTPAPEGEAGEDVVEAVKEETVTEEPEAAENTEGQEEGQPAEGETPEESPSKVRRERRKAHMERLKEEADKAKSELEKVQQRLSKYEQAAQEAQPPKEKDFDDYAEYQAELAAFKSMKALDGRQRQEIEEEANSRQQQIKQLEAQEAQEIQENWQSQMADGVAKYADFAEIALSGRVPITDKMARVIQTSEVGADVAYHLGKNIQEAAAIAKMSDLEMARHIGRIEAGITTPKPRTQSTAPDPISPVKPKATGTKDPGKMSMAEYKKAREAGKI
ncbi:MAG: hypothetical protein ACPG4X_20810 [Pikeienuella sp.]